jgi:hypothetical protein
VATPRTASVCRTFMGNLLSWVLGSHHSNGQG